MKIRQLLSFVALDGGSQVRRLEAALAHAQQLLDAEVNRGMERELQASTTLLALRAERDRLAALEKNAQGELARFVSLNGELAESNLELRHQLTLAEAAARSFRESNIQLEKELVEERRTLEETTARAVTRINALEIEIDALRAKLDAGDERQLDLVAAPDAPDAKAEIVFDKVLEKVYRLAKISFVDGHKWYWSDGGSEAFHARILDEEFNRRVARRDVTFASGDAARVRVHQVSTRKGDHFKTDCEIVEVIEILPPPPEQTNLLHEAKAS